MPKKPAKKAKASRKRITKVSLKPIADAIKRAVKDLKGAVGQEVDARKRSILEGRIATLENIEAKLPCHHLAGYPVDPEDVE